MEKRYQTKSYYNRAIITFASCFLKYLLQAIAIYKLCDSLILLQILACMH
jgi:hypothetical protein